MRLASFTNPNPKVRKSGAVGKAVLAQDHGFDGAKSSFLKIRQHKRAITTALIHDIMYHNYNKNISCGL